MTKGGTTTRILITRSTNYKPEYLERAGFNLVLKSINYQSPRDISAYFLFIQLFVSNEVIPTVKRKVFSYFWKNKNDKIERVGLYQDYRNGGLRMTDLECMVKALRMA